MLVVTLELKCSMLLQLCCIIKVTCAPYSQRTYDYLYHYCDITAKLNTLAEDEDPLNEMDILACRTSTWMNATEKQKQLWYWYASELLPTVNVALRTLVGNRKVTELLTVSDEALVLSTLKLYYAKWIRLNQSSDKEDKDQDADDKGTNSRKGLTPGKKHKQ